MRVHNSLIGDPNFSSEEVGDKPIYRCELCPTTCGRKTDLRIHVQKLHTSDKPLKCKRCGKTFPDRYTYKVSNIFLIFVFLFLEKAICILCLCNFIDDIFLPFLGPQ